MNNIKKINRKVEEFFLGAMKATLDKCQKNGCYILRPGLDVYSVSDVIRYKSLKEFLDANGMILFAPGMKITQKLMRTIITNLMFNYDTHADNIFVNMTVASKDEFAKETEKFAEFKRMSLSIKRLRSYEELEKERQELLDKLDSMNDESSVLCMDAATYFSKHNK